MDPEPGNPMLDQPMHGYERAAVDDFLAAAATERARLEATIADANGRAARARAAIGMHRVMVAMLLETQGELTLRRREAEQQAAEIIAAAEAQAQEIERSAGVVPSAPTADPIIDIRRAELYDGSSFDKISMRIGAGLDGEPDDRESEKFFEFLRGALVDDEPLGPRPE
jgi:regulator of protease activity HflC (stomatin/prohibitin superfamily)